MNDEVEYLNSIQGKPQFVISGFIYEKERSKIGSDGIETIYARCSRQRRDGCRGRVILVKSNSAHLIKKPCADDDHSHPPMLNYIAEQRIKNAMKQRVLNHPTRPVQHSYDEIVQEVLEEDNVHVMPTFDNVSTILYRKRAELRPPLPFDREHIVLNNPEYTMCKDESFVIFNTAGKDKIVVFGTEIFFKILCDKDSCKTIYMDGTFKVVPKLFYQLYTIHAFYKKQMLPFIYILLPNKSEKTYLKMFDELKNAATRLGVNFKPTKIMVDFELAAIHAAEKSFPGV